MHIVHSSISVADLAENREAADVHQALVVVAGVLHLLPLLHGAHHVGADVLHDA